MARTVSTRTGALILGGVVVLVMIFATLEREPDRPIDPAEVFVDQHPELGLGAFRTSRPMPNWAGGTRRQIQTTTGGYLFYFQAREVVTVYTNDERERVEVWRKPDSEADREET